PIVALILEWYEAHVVKRVTTEDRCSVKILRARLINSALFHQRCSLVIFHTFECFSAEHERINFNKLDAVCVVHAECGRQLTGDVAILSPLKPQVDFIENYHV